MSHVIRISVKERKWDCGSVWAQAVMTADPAATGLENSPSLNSAVCLFLLVSLRWSQKHVPAFHCYIRFRRIGHWHDTPTDMVSVRAGTHVTTVEQISIYAVLCSNSLIIITEQLQNGKWDKSIIIGRPSAIRSVLLRKAADMSCDM